MRILKIYIEKHLLIEYYVIKLLILLRSKTWWISKRSSIVKKFFGKETPGRGTKNENIFKKEVAK